MPMVKMFRTIEQSDPAHAGGLLYFFNRYYNWNASGNSRFGEYLKKLKIF